MERMFRSAQPGDLVLLYFSGHGVRSRNGRLHLAVSNTDLGVLSAAHRRRRPSPLRPHHPKTPRTHHPRPHHVRRPRRRPPHRQRPTHPTTTRTRPPHHPPRRHPTHPTRPPAGPGDRRVRARCRGGRKPTKVTLPATTVVAHSWSLFTSSHLAAQRFRARSDRTRLRRDAPASPVTATAHRFARRKGRLPPTRVMRRSSTT